MRRRPSSSGEDEDSSKPAIPATLSEHNGDVTRHGARDKDGIRATKTAQSLPQGRAPARDVNSTSHQTIQWPQPTLPSAHASQPHTGSHDAAQSRRPDSVQEHRPRRRTAQQSPWSFNFLSLTAGLAAILLLAATMHSFLHRQTDPKGCNMSYMMPIFTHFSDFDTEHTRFATKYSLYLYREGGVDEDTRVKGIPVIFVPGNAGSYKQVRPLAAEAATYFHNVLREDDSAIASGKRPLDFFSVDFNEDITAFHGQTLLDQAEYLNEAVAYILALYHNPSTSLRESHLPDPKSVIIVGHSMGGVVARAMLRMPNYQENSINTIVTLSAPHARAPVSFDADMVAAYDDINTYWRRSYSTSPPGRNPLTDVTLVSVAGGGLDTMIPSEYTSLTSIVPDTHGFTVFTSGIPQVWTGMDHLAIMWCDQFRKALIRSIFDVVDARRRSQTLPRHERITAFRRRLLTGMESIVEQLALTHPMDTLVILDDSPDRVTVHDSRLHLRTLSGYTKAHVHLMPIAAQSASTTRRFTLLTDQILDRDDEKEPLTVMLCSQYESDYSQSFAFTIDLSTNSSTSTQLACKNASPDVSFLPASTHSSTNAFDDAKPLSYLQYDIPDASAHQSVLVLENASHGADGWVIAELTSIGASSISVDKGHQQLLVSGLHLALPAVRPMMMDLKIPEVHSTLFAYTLKFKQSPCDGGSETFSPLLRQYVSEPYESKYFVNTQGGNINVHGISPYMPPPLHGGPVSQGLGLQLWTDPLCNSTVEIALDVDMLGSAGKLVMRYRTVFAALPLLVALIVMRRQFKIYDATGIFISFSESMGQCIRTSLPFVVIALTFLAVSLSKATQGSWTRDWLTMLTGTAYHSIDFNINDLLLGTQDPFLWFLVPLFGIISIGLCIAGNYLVTILMFTFALIYGKLRPFWVNDGEARKSISASFVTSTPFQRLITTAILLLLVTTLVPYQFAYMVLTIVQLATCVRACRLARETNTVAHYNLYNYTHTLLLLMLWVLPINLPVLIVWIHNLAMHWLTPFSTHHNLLAVLPLVLIVEVMSMGRMIPQVTNGLRHVTKILTFIAALYAAVYGVTYAYRLHYIFNIISSWLLVIHFTQAGNEKSASPGKPLRSLLQAKENTNRGQGSRSTDSKKTP